ncbi:branched-chain amino acid ABC transporter permease [Methylopila henanensis]|uniref:Branched-chain amino acid ABC transporter permease n=1 Tax=Methylopila henanensis TaxID=873516 RepID=A0ABW4K3G0_9HYPH
MTARLLAVAAALVALVAIGLLADNYVLRLAATACMYAALALSWNLVGGFAGYPSFATAAFFGLGAYASGVAQDHSLPFWLAWVGAGTLAAAFAAALGGAILHLKGHYFAIASLVVADVLRELVNSWTDVTGGGMGLNLPLIALGGPRAQAAFYFAAFAAVAIFALGVAFIVSRSRLGVGLRCVAENETAAPLIGVSVRSAKVKAFTLSGLIGGLTGAVYASWVTYIDPTDVFDVLLSVKPIIMALIGGVGTVLGPVVGAIVFLGLEELIWRNVLEFHAGVLGLVVVALVLFLPAGLSGAKPFGLIRWIRGRAGRRGSA